MDSAWLVTMATFSRNLPPASLPHAQSLFPLRPLPSLTHCQDVEPHRHMGPPVRPLAPKPSVQE